MKIVPTEIPEVIQIVPDIFHDDRGFFMEVFHTGRFQQEGLPSNFVQDNLSHSKRGVLRGLHYQIDNPQGKFVTCLNGEIFDVAVDLRKSSPTFRQWVGVTLRASERNSLYIPPGFAHGFYVLSETADVFYKCTDLYSPRSERTLLWNDPDIGVKWPVTGDPIVSVKDLNGLRLAQAECFP
jgi:dTDP-4-dehydrorhamnose 3,5-epimerase